MEFTKSLKRLREEKDLSQEELAKLVGITQAAISQYERGEKKPTIIIAGKIAKALGTTVDAMIKGE